jgi:hypothetical protein
MDGNCPLVCRASPDVIAPPALLAGGSRDTADEIATEDASPQPHCSCVAWPGSQGYPFDPPVTWSGSARTSAYNPGR